MLPMMADLSSAQAQSLSDWAGHFRQLAAPTDHVGSWRAELVGPWWLREFLAPVNLRLCGFRGWVGKRFDGRSGANLARRGPLLREFAPFSLKLEASRLDGKPALILRYAGDLSFPLPRMRDEFRQLNARSLLGLSYTDLPGIRKLGLPFLLHRCEVNQS